MSKERNAVGPKQRRRTRKAVAAVAQNLFRGLYISFEKTVSYPFRILL
jgi:hypothetical protein